LETGRASYLNDGKRDIIFTGNKVVPRIYHNKGNFEFPDISSSFEGPENMQWYSCNTYVDITNEGYSDMYMSKYLKTNY